MRCICCNVALSKYESTMKTVSTNEYVDMCESCLSYVSDDVKVITREDLREEVGTDVANYIDSINPKGVYDE